MTRATCFASLSFFLVLLLSPAASAQSAEEGTVSGSGMVTLKQKPTRLRMSIQFVEEAPTLEEALGKLQDRTKAARLQLESMDAARDSLQTSEPTLVEKSEQQNQMQRMMRQQLAMQGRRLPKGLEAPKTIKVGSTVTAEWELPTDSQEKLLLLVSNVQEQVTAADLAGLNEPKELSPAEEELAEEMEQMMESYSYGEEQQKPGEPQFVYVGTITDEQRQEALKSAFAKAKAQAEEVAEAAGATLGKLATINGSTTSVADPEYGYAMMQMWSQSGLVTSQAQENEAIAARPEAVGFQIMVQATFALQDGD